MKTSNKLKEIKQDYKTISIPKNLEQRVQLGIIQAKNETKTRQVFYQKPVFWAKFGGCVAVAMAAFVLLANFSAPVAHAMNNLPILGSIVKIVSFRTFESSEKDMNASVNIPEVEVKDSAGNTNKETTEKLNTAITEYTNQIIAQYEKDVAETNGEGKENVTTDYEILSDSPRLFSLKINTVISLNTSDNTIKIYHVDKTTGSMISLQDIFQKDSSYLSILTAEIKRQMREQMANDDSLSYFIDDMEIPEANWQGLTDDANFYIKQGKLIIVFDKYEVAPGYMSVCEFVIPEDTIRDIIKAEYLK